MSVRSMEIYMKFGELFRLEARYRELQDCTDPWKELTRQYLECKLEEYYKQIMKEWEEDRTIEMETKEQLKN